MGVGEGAKRKGRGSVMHHASCVNAESIYDTASEVNGAWAAKKQVVTGQPSIFTGSLRPPSCLHPLRLISTSFRLRKLHPVRAQGRRCVS